MSTVQEIQEAVSQLASEDLEAFRLWLAEFNAVRWDRQFEADVRADRLDQLAEEALQICAKGAAPICKTPRDTALRTFKWKKYSGQAD